MQAGFSHTLGAGTRLLEPSLLPLKVCNRSKLKAGTKTKYSNGGRECLNQQLTQGLPGTYSNPGGLKLCELLSTPLAVVSKTKSGALWPTVGYCCQLQPPQALFPVRYVEELPQWTPLWDTELPGEARRRAVFATWTTPHIGEHTCSSMNVTQEFPGGQSINAHLTPGRSQPWRDKDSAQPASWVSLK